MGPASVPIKSSTKYINLYPGRSYGLLGGPGLGPQQGASSSAAAAIGMESGCRGDAHPSGLFSPGQQSWSKENVLGLSLGLFSCNSSISTSSKGYVK
jgi:hypothetical protein